MMQIVSNAKVWVDGILAADVYEVEMPDTKGAPVTIEEGWVAGESEEEKELISRRRRAWRGNERCR